MPTSAAVAQLANRIRAANPLAFSVGESQQLAEEVLKLIAEADEKHYGALRYGQLRPDDPQGFQSLMGEAEKLKARVRNYEKVHELELAPPHWST